MMNEFNDFKVKYGFDSVLAVVELTITDDNVTSSRIVGLTAKEHDTVYKLIGDLHEDEYDSEITDPNMIADIEPIFAEMLKLYSTEL